MPIFQKSIVDKYLGTLEVDVLNDAYNSYKEVYGAQKIKRIRKLKEEQYQGGFLKDIFGSVLGYTIDPEVGYNIELEKKNETNAKKADGAILKEEKVLGVIELKSNSTKNLESIKDQAFGYKNNHKGCKYVISSNFHKLRFYIDDATEYEEFDLYNLDKDTFKKFFLYLRKEGLLDKNIPKLLKEETKFHEENISKQLYKDYSAFKNKFFENIVKNNPQYDKLLLFKKSQKFLDRILFILFAEDKGLIPTNAISRIVESWALADEMHQKSLYELLRILFSHLNVGHTYKSGYEIPPYNGGLFAPDEVLDNIKVDDEVLKDDLLTLSKYDFNTDVDVNILGHIFEHSLTEIEEIEAKIKGEEADKSKGKRKKDGVFYTPKYITKYIVDNTVGKLCSEKKEELGLDIDFDVQDYQKSNGSVNAKGKQLFHTLELYKEWLISLKILDPACGSGAFLNQALSFLIEEHKNIDDLIAELTNSPLRIFDTDKAILENNIFGVDINDESVEIAKLSLWLRTAQKGRKLSNLNDNIKCGNSLIDEPEIAGDKAFKWEEEFSEILKNGGFDVIIGNPPYVQIKDFNDYFNNEYNTSPSGDLYSLFYEKSLHLLTNNGLLGFITPSSFMTNIGFVTLREELLKNKIKSLIDLGANVFSDASVDSAVIIIQKGSASKNKLKVGSQLDVLIDFEQEIFGELANKIFNIYLNPKGLELCDNLEKKYLQFNDYISFSRGVEFGFRSDKVLNEKSDEMHVPLLCGGNIGKQEIVFENKYIKFDINDTKIYKTKKIYEKEKILVKRIGNTIIGSYDGDGYYNVCDVYNLQLKTNDNYSLKSVSSFVNSKLINFFYDTKFKSVKKLFPKIPIQNLKLLPIPKYIDDVDGLLNQLTDEILHKKALLVKRKKQFIQYIKSDLNISELPSKLKNWNESEFKDFIKLLNKTIKKCGTEKLTKKDEIEWLEVFESKKSEALELKDKIDQTDKEIDQMVYELYELTAEEIEIVENS
ncbi:N-6 DNA methylase [Algibacter sp.]|nr:N-6 DNA methylase [Algibacter sp.]